MNSACGSINPNTWVESLIRVTDCQAGLLGSGGFQGLSGSGLFTVLLTGLLTLAVARLGYRLMAGDVMPADIVMLMVHIGVVIALATSWQAYDRLIYRVAMDGPSEIATALFPAAGIRASGLSARLQNAYDTIAPPPEMPDIADDATNAAGANDPQSASPRATELAPPPESLAMQERRAAADVMVVSGAGSWMAARLGLAVLLALGPFAFAASLFPVSAGLFVGWCRAVLGFALAALVIPLAISLELQMLEGPVRAALRAESMDIAGLGPIVWSFVLVIIGMVFAVHRLAGGLSLTLPVLRINAAQHDSGTQGHAATSSLTTSATTSHLSPARAAPAAPVIPSRTSGIVRAVEARDRDTGSSRGALASARNPQYVLQAASAAGARTIRRGSQIVDGARRTSADRGRFLPQRPEAQA